MLGNAASKSKRIRAPPIMQQGDLHGLVVYVKDVGSHLPTAEEASLGFRDKQFKDRLQKNPIGAGNEPVVCIDQGQRSSSNRGEVVTNGGVMPSGLLR